jgi:hypothetical protein
VSNLSQPLLSRWKRGDVSVGLALEELLHVTVYS